MIASHGTHVTAAHVRAVSRFYDADPWKLAYWRSVLNEIERAAVSVTRNARAAGRLR